MPKPESKKEENAGPWQEELGMRQDYSAPIRAGETVNLQPPYVTKSVQSYCDVVGWPVGVAFTQDSALLVADDAVIQSRESAINRK